MRTLIPAMMMLALFGCGDGGQDRDANLMNSVADNDAVEVGHSRIGPGDFSQGGMAGCFDPDLSGVPRRAAEEIGGVPCDEPTTPSEGQQGASSPDGGFNGYWTGPLDGGDGEARIFSNGRPNGYDVDLTLAGHEGCSGQMVGPGTASGNRLVLTQTIPNGGGQCRVTFTRNGSTLSVSESNCSYNHGMSCGFAGTLRFKQADDPLAPPMDDF